MSRIQTILQDRLLHMSTMAALFVLGFLLVVPSAALAQWQADQRLTNNSDSSMISTTTARSVAVSGDTVHVVWRDGRDGNNEIYYKRSTDGGVFWGADVRLTNDTASSSIPCIAVLGSVVHVCWSDYRNGEAEIYYTSSRDAGERWGEDVRLTNGVVQAGTACLAVSGSMVHLVWRDARLGSLMVFYKRSTDQGLHWEADMRLSMGSTMAYNPSVAVADSCVHVVWNDRRDGNLEIYYRRSADAGQSWGDDVRLTNDGYFSQLPSVAVSGSSVHVAWNDTRDGKGDIYHLRSTDGGLTWGGETALTDQQNEASWPSICRSGSNVHVVWQDTRDGNNEIYYKRSTDAGTTWEADTRLTNGGTSAEKPTMAVSLSTIHIVWMDKRDSPNGEIYYKRNPTGNLVTGKHDADPVPETSVLLQNFPNPYYCATTISYSIPREEHIRLTVHDLLGRIVATVVDARQAAGPHAMHFDAVQLPAGIYQCRIEYEGTVVTNMMTVLQ